MYHKTNLLTAVLVVLTIIATSSRAGEGVVWSDDFEQYKDGQELHGHNGWQALRAPVRVTSAENHTEGGSLSVDISGDGSLVREFADEFGAMQDSGQWIFRAWEYVPSEMTRTSFFIMLNTYDEGGRYSWSVQIRHNAEVGIIRADYRGEELPLITDRWVPIEVHIDLDTDIAGEGVHSFFYDGAPLYEGVSWCDGLNDGGCGEVEIGAINFFANDASPMYYDDIALEHLPRILGACCDEGAQTCTDDGHRGDCTENRFKRSAACKDLDPACGSYNDECASAIEIGADDSFTEDSAGATWSFDDRPQCFNGGDQGHNTLWFKFTAVDRWTVVRTCSSPAEGGAEDTILSVYPSGPEGECLHFEPHIACSDDACGQPSGLHAEVCVETQPGEVYHVMVGNKPGTRPGLFTIETSSHAQCPGNCDRDPVWCCDGDVDGDCQVNPVDSGLVQAAFGSADEQDLCNYDVDCDGQINPVDAGLVQSLFGTCEEPRDVCP